MIDVALQLPDVGSQDVGAEFVVIQDAPARVLIAHAFQNAQGWNYESMMHGDGASEARVEDVTPVRKEMCKSIGASLDGIERLSLAMNMNDR